MRIIVELELELQVHPAFYRYQDFFLIFFFFFLSYYFDEFVFAHLGVSSKSVRVFFFLFLWLIILDFFLKIFCPNQEVWNLRGGGVVMPHILDYSQILTPGI